MNQLQLYRQGIATVQIPIDENTIYLDECMGRIDISCQFYSANILDIQADDYIIYNGVRYTINVPYQISRSAEIQYNITFEHPSYWLKDIQLKHLGAVEFAYFGTPTTLIQLIVENMNVDDNGWAVGTCEVMDEINFDFYADSKGYSCKSALQLIAETFKLEYWFSGDGKTINLTKQAGNNTNIHFEYGRTKGLYSIERGILDTPLYNRIYGFGAMKNISRTYRNGAKRLMLSNPIERPLLPGERRRETSVIFEDIFPQRTSTLTAVSGGYLTLTDSTIDFDLNGNRINGEQAKVVFKSGELSGQEFEIASYNHSTKTIKIKPNTDANGYELPNSTFEPKTGDKYTLVGISQPQSYVDQAESDLLEAVNKSFKTLTRPPYKVEIDEKYMRDNGFSLHSGDRVRLVDKNLGIDDLIRITSVSFPLVNPYQCTVVISDKITYTREVEIIIDQGKIKEDVKYVDRNLVENNRKQSLAVRQFRDMVFDPDNNLQGTFQALMIEAMSALFGTESQNFDLVGVFIKANADNNPNKITFTAGNLVHHKYSIEGVGNTWVMTSYSNDALVSTSTYYISAKCSMSSLTGTWVLSTTPIGTDDEDGFWHFNLGVISSVIDDQRFTNITKGFTFITGGQILTENLIARHIQTATSGARTTINVLPSDNTNPTFNTDHYNSDALRQYHASGRISMYEGVVRDVSIVVAGTLRIVNGHAKIVFKDQVGSPIHYVIDSYTANGLQYASNGDTVQYYAISGHRLLTSSLSSDATDEDILNILFTYESGLDQYIPRSSVFCGFYQYAIYTLSIGITPTAGTVWQRVSSTSSTKIVTENNGTTPVTSGWYYKLNSSMSGYGTSADDIQIVFDLSIQVQFVNTLGEISVTKNLAVNDVKWHQGGAGGNTCVSGTPQVEIQ